MLDSLYCSCERQQRAAVAHTLTHTCLSLYWPCKRWSPGHHHLQMTGYMMNLKHARIHLHCLSLHLSLFISKKILNTRQCSFKIWKCIHIYVFLARISCIICHMKFTRTFQPLAVNWICPHPIYFLFQHAQLVRFPQSEIMKGNSTCFICKVPFSAPCADIKTTHQWIWS